MLPHALDQSLIGHQKYFNLLKILYAQQTLHPCWILYGQKGIGKSTFSYHFAEYILSKNPLNPTGLSKGVVHHQIKINSYPNLLILAQSNIFQEDSQEIPFLEAKRLQRFLNQSPAIPGWRVIIVDAIDEMNRFAINSLLKIFEEPPLKTLFLLICHNFSKVPATLRSRCQKLNFLPLQPEDVDLLMRSSFDKDLFHASQGSIGRYQNVLKSGGNSFLNLLKETINFASQGQWVQVYKFCQDTARIPEQFETFIWLKPQLIYDKIMSLQGPQQKRWLEISRKINFLLKAKDNYVDKFQLITACFLAIENPYLN